MIKINKRTLTFTLCAVIFICLTVYILWANTALEVTVYAVHDPKLPKEFDGYRIAQVSDLHNARFGENNTELIEMLEAADPDIIVLTGDLYDIRRGSTDICVSFAGKAADIAPTYYVSGNHDADLEDYEAYTQALEAAGVTVLENKTAVLMSGDESITLAGIDDPARLREYEHGDNPTLTLNALARTLDENSGYTILLAHRPELIDIYSDKGVSLVFSGHAHGGQFRFPIVGGLFAPGQGILPEYDSGLYTVGDTHMIVSRGLGNSGFPLRLNNRPEVVIAELYSNEVTNEQ